VRDTDKRRRNTHLPRHGLSKLQNGASKPGQGGYTRKRLLQMDARFCERLKHAIACGKEHTSLICR
jgi:hypothetical protein